MWIANFYNTEKKLKASQDLNCFEYGAEKKVGRFEATWTRLKAKYVPLLVSIMNKTYISDKMVVKKRYHPKNGPFQKKFFNKTANVYRIEL